MTNHPLLGCATALLLAACGAAPAAVQPAPPVHAVTAPPAATETPTAALALGADAEDSAYRYQVPAPYRVDFKAPAITRAVAAGGIELVVAEDHRLPLVSFAVQVGFQSPPKLAGVRHAWAGALWWHELRDTPTPLAALERPGAVSLIADQDGVGFMVEVPSPLAADAVTEVMNALQKGTLDQTALDRFRKAREGDEERLTPRDRTAMLGIEVLHPAGHPYHETRFVSAERLLAMRLADLEADRKNALATDTITIVAVGDITAASLGAAVDRAQLPRRPRAKGASRPATLGRGALIADDPSVTQAEIVIAFPMNAHGGDPMTTALFFALDNRWSWPSGDGAPPSWSAPDASLTTFLESTLLRVSVTVAPGDVLPALEAARRRIDALGKQGIAPSDYRPSMTSDWLETRYDGHQETMERLLLLVTTGGTATADDRVAERLAAFRREDTAAAAKEQLTFSRASLGVLTNAPLDTAAIAALGFGPVKERHLAASTKVTP